MQSPVTWYGILGSILEQAILSFDQAVMLSASLGKIEAMPGQAIES